MEIDGRALCYVLIEDEKWWNRRLNRNKTGNATHAFVRRGRVGPKEAQKILFYVKQPMKQIKGFGEFLRNHWNKLQIMGPL